MRRSLFFLMMAAALAGRGQGHRFELGDSSFLLDGKPFLMISGEMHYTRVPREAWRQRMRMARAMGLNTVGTYVFWNVHEPEKGKFDFSGNNDIAEFVRTAKEEGLWVVLRPSPYVCAEWEFGGYPYWLEKEAGLVVRSKEPKYLEEYRRYIREVGRQLAPLQVNHGGNILMVQIENEYGSYASDKEYLEINRRMFVEAGFDGLLYTCDPPGDVAKGSLPGLLPAVNGVDRPERVKEIVRKNHNGKGPYYIAEWYPAWFDWWGTKHHRVAAEQYAGRLDSVLGAGVSINMYMFHGGTTRGFMNGANYNDRNPYEPQISSYDYDAPLDEAGNATAKFMEFRKVIERHLPAGVVLPDVPAAKPAVKVGPVRMTEVGSVFDLLPKGVAASRPQSFEELGQAYGYVLYRSEIEGGAGVLRVGGLRDFGIVFVNGKRVGVLDRRLRQDSLLLELPAGKVRVDILVENLGRINFGPYLLKNTKGIVGKVEWKGKEAMGWTMYGLPFDRVEGLALRGDAGGGPVVRRGSFEMAAPADTYLDMRKWGKGCVWVNGHNLGRYWRVGPQQTVYVPAEWLKQGANEVVVFELLKPEQEVLEGIDHAVLDELDGEGAQGDRATWISYLDKVSRPVMQALAEDRLHEKMPVVLSMRIDNAEERRRVTYLEAFGRTLSGIGRWLDSEEGPAAEVALRRQYREWALKAVANAVNPAAADYMVWKGGQPLVDASFFALGLIRCPWLWQHLDAGVQKQVVSALVQTRATTPGYSNWLLFPAVIEAFFCKYGLEYDAVRIEYAVREFSQHWYLGDGTFADGPAMHQDYYNSYVIQPFLLAVLDVMKSRYTEFSGRMLRIAKRYAEIQERMIGVDGSYPVTGRSITYRCGAFHALADVAARGQLPASLSPGQVRSALTAVIRRTLGAPGTFTKEGWLHIGVAGHQEKLADAYITMGSEYLCTEVFQPLGLPMADSFWAAPAMPWTAVKVWGGGDSVNADHALDLVAAAGPGGKSGDGWRLVWADEFNTDGPPNPKNWGFEKGFVRNHEAQWYQPENAWCKDGKLIIEARKERKPNPLYDSGSTDWRRKSPTIEYTSASLLTRGLHHFRYGRFEMRAKIDVSPGLWPAFWALGEKGDWPSNGEIDIMEYYRRMLLANIATGTDRKNSPLWFSKKTPIDSLGGEAWASAFHVWRMDWDEKAIVLSVDGRTLLSEPLDSLVNRDGSGVNPFRERAYLILNLALGGDAGGDVSGTSFPRRYEVDYVRVYQRDNGGIGLWLDDRGEHIQAHGGGILKMGKTYYWYGEERRQGLDTVRRYVSGYASTDLMHWKFLGDVLQLDDPEQLGAHWVLERPKVYYNKPTKKYVMYFHLDNRSYKFARVGVAVSDGPAGPFRYVKSFRPLDHESRDIGQFVDDDGKGYLIFEDRPFGFRIARLAEADYMSIDKEMCLIPQHMEGGAVVRFGGLYYAIGSRLSGWKANPNVYATSTSLEGPWSEFTNIAPPETNTYGCQSTMLLKVEGSKDTTVVFMGDVWRPGMQWESTYLWMPVEIGGGKLWVPEPKGWVIDLGTGKWNLRK